MLVSAIDGGAGNFFFFFLVCLGGNVELRDHCGGTRRYCAARSTN